MVGNPLEGRDVAELEAAITAEIERVKTEPIAGWEMQKARTTARSALVNSLGSALNRAVLLSEYALFYDNPDRINTQADRIRQGERRRRAAGGPAVSRGVESNGGHYAAGESQA